MTTFAGQWGPLVPTLPGDTLEVTPGDPVAVRRASDGQLATLYTTRMRQFTTANPTFIDVDGNLVVFAEPGQYTLHRVTLGVEGEGQLVSVPIDPREVGSTNPSGLYINANERGAVAGQDSSVAIQTALDEAGASGGTVMLGPGEYLAEGLVHPANVVLVGAGYGATVLKLKDDANTFLMESLSFEDLTGGGTNGGIGQWGWRDISFDGNADNNAADIPLLRYYGYDFNIERVRVRKANGVGLWAEWGGDAAAPSPDSMEATVRDLKVHDCGDDGIVWKGPHDSMWSEVITYSNNQRNVGGMGMNILPDGGALVMLNCHSWGLEQAHAMWFGANVLAMNCHAEGATGANVVIAANDCWYVGSVDAARTTGATLKGIQIGTDDVEVAGTVFDAFIGNCLNGAIDYVNDAQSRGVVNAFTVSPVAARVGSPAVQSSLDLSGNATDVGVYSPNPQHLGIFKDQLIIETADGVTQKLRTTSLVNKRVRQDYAAQGVDQWAWITDKDVANVHDIILFDPINGRQLLIGRDDGTMEFPRFYKRETVVASTPYTALLSDVGTVIGTFLAGANVVTIPPNSTAAFPIGTFLEICQLGAGQTTLNPGGGVALRSSNGLKTRAQWSTVRLYKRDTNEWVVSGDTAP